MATVHLRLMYVSDVACNMATVWLRPMSARGYSISVMLSLNDYWQSNMKFAKKYLIPNTPLWNFSYHFTPHCSHIRFVHPLFPFKIITLVKLPSTSSSLLSSFPKYDLNTCFAQTHGIPALTDPISKSWTLFNNIISKTFFIQPWVKFLCNNHLFKPPLHDKEPKSTHFTLRNH